MDALCRARLRALVDGGQGDGWLRQTLNLGACLGPGGLLVRAPGDICLWGVVRSAEA